MAESTQITAKLKKNAWFIIVMMGLVSLFGDLLYEGARSVNGPYLKTLGANAAAVGFIAGVGEFFGYGLRLLSGYFADKTRSYWTFVFIGYGLIISVPLLSLAGVWQMAAVFIVMERFGKALRAPARDTIVSQATKHVGTGIGFGISEAMDQIGALVGPLIFTIYFAYLGNGNKSSLQYRHAYALFWIPFIVLMSVVTAAYLKMRSPGIKETTAKTGTQPDKLTKVFWLYTAFTFLTAFGFTNWALLGYHFKNKGVITDTMIPLMYAGAMIIDGIFALLIGKFYDVLKEKKKNEKGGLSALLVLPVLSVFIPLFGFSASNIYGVIVCVVLWGLVMGTQETIMKSAIADLTSIRKRGTGYGIFNTAYGLAVFLGAWLMGVLYDRSLTATVAVAAGFQLLSVPVLILMMKEAKKA